MGLVSTKYIDNCNTDVIVGCGGIEYWNFKGLSKGTQTLKLEQISSDGSSVIWAKFIDVTVK